MSAPRVLDIRPTHAATADAPPPAPAAERVTLLGLLPDGALRVRNASGTDYLCDWLDTGAAAELAVDDRLLALPPDASGRGVVLGRLGPYRAPQPQARLTLEATEVLTLKCGDVSIDLRAADGKLMLRGDDVLLRAKGTQRIRAGNVAIN